VRTKTAAYLAELARMCRQVGGHIMVLGSPQQRNLLAGVSHDDAMKYAADVITQAEPVFAEHDVTLALEPLGPGEGDFLLTAASGAKLMDLIDSPHVRLHLDVKAMSTEETEIPVIIEANADRIAHFHANDPNLLGPGMGDVDFGPIFAALKRINYQDWVSVEVFDYSPGIEKIARESIANMRRHL
jgi:sugar phosphate isomerase/epimerase